MLDDALDHIAAEQPTAALRWLDEVMERVRSLERFPDLGRVIPELQRPEIREILLDRYRVPYRRDEQQITILAVVHHRRQFDLSGENAREFARIPGLQLEVWEASPDAR